MNKSALLRVAIAFWMLSAPVLQSATAEPTTEAQVQPVVVTLTQIGGTKKIDHPIEMNASTLSDQDQALLTKLLNQSGVLEVKSMKQMGYVTPTVTQWRLAVAAGPNDQHQITLDENTMSAEYSRLIKFILKRDKKKVAVH